MRHKREEQKPQKSRVRIRNQLQIETRIVQMAATVASNRSPAELFISRATIQLRQPQTVAPPRIYEWRTQVIPESLEEIKETPVECIKQNGSKTTAAAPPKYTPPRIQGNEAKRKNLPQTLGNFFEAERYASAWNRVTK